MRSWHQRVHTALFKINDQQGLTVKHRELCSTSCGSWMRGQFCKKLCTIWMAKSLCSPSVSAATMSIGYSQIKIKIGSNTQQLGITYEHTGWAPFTCGQTRNPEEDWEKGSLFCLHWECQLVNNHCKEQQNGATETSRQQWPKIWSTHPWACCQGNYTLKRHVHPNLHGSTTSKSQTTGQPPGKLTQAWTT